jgi:hypothetical protein
MENSEAVRKYIENFQDPYTILAEYRLLDIRSTIALEIRKSTRGCMAHTVIDGIPYCVVGGDIEGCVWKILKQLPKDSMIIIPHPIPIETDRQIFPFVIYEEFCYGMRRGEENLPEASPDTCLAFRWQLNGEEARIEFRGRDDIEGFVGALQRFACEKRIKTLKICLFCSFYLYYLNLSVCARDLLPDEFEHAQELLMKRELLVRYYGKMAWNMETFHYCAAFVKSTNPENW